MAAVVESPVESALAGRASLRAAAFLFEHHQILCSLPVTVRSDPP
jgi:hypothetical protein